jgi:hypothetical protein
MTFSTKGFSFCINGDRQIIIRINPCKQIGVDLQGVGPDAHIPYVHAKQEIDQLQVSP